MDQSYIAIGYGTAMANTDMCYWGANGSGSLQQDLWSTGNKQPTVDAVNAYTTSFVVNADNSVSFKSTRPLAPSDSSDTYVIQLNTDINMITAYLTTTYQLSYHGVNHY
jgi:hypothetical protein